MDRFNEVSARKVASTNSEVEVIFTKKYLDKTSNSGCYEETNLGSPEQLTAAKKKLLPILEFHDDPKTIVSIGVGSGAELLALSELFDSKSIDIMGLDLSSVVIENAIHRIEKYGLASKFVLGSAINLPFKNCSIDVIIESALLHEIYSYVPNGKKAWKKAITDVADTLSENGILLLRDFSTPTEKSMKLEFKSEFSKRFYKYFVDYYRVFQQWDGESSKIIDRRNYNSKDYPVLELTSNHVYLDLPKIAEFMLHFRNFFEDYSHGITTFMDKGWKEINETYLVPRPDGEGIVPMSREEYVRTVIATANAELANKGYELICLQNKLSERQDTAEFLREHFTLRDSDVGNIDEDTFIEITDKMEVVFKKIKKGGLKDFIRL